MRLRFFFLISLTFLLALVSSSAIFFQGFSEERIRILDEQLEKNLQSILLTESFRKGGASAGEIAKALESAIGPYRLGHVVVLKNSAGELIFANTNAQLLDLSGVALERQPRFVEVDGRTLRLVERKIARNQVLIFGTFVNRKQFFAGFIEQVKASYLIALFIGTLALSFALASLLLRPLRNLEKDLRALTQQMGRRDSGSIGLVRFAENLKRKQRKQLFLPSVPDEFSQLSDAVTQFVTEVRDTLQSYEAVSARLAHEMNTPLAIIRNEAVMARADLPPESRVHIDCLIEELDSLAEFIRRFLEWSSLVLSPPGQTEIHAVKLKNFVQSMSERVSPLSAGRLRLTVDLAEDRTLFVNPSDLEHTFYNLVTNALKYSPPSEPVFVEVDARGFRVLDQGYGIPEAVMSKLGQPFNHGAKRASSQGTGLGLAWVDSVVRKYGWSWRIKSSQSGTTIELEFESASAQTSG